jgi:hypothetical protein
MNDGILIRSKYHNRISLINASIFWKEVNKEMIIFNTSINKKNRNGHNILFWKDRWLTECAFQSQFLLLFTLAYNQYITVAEVMGYNRFYLSSNRILNPTLREQLQSLYIMLSSVSLASNQDI